jgi:Fur family ferric uptake transcriptional regulator
MVRNTRQRGAIRRAFQHADRPLSPAEVHASARPEVKGLGIATVYRNIRALLDEGWLVQVDQPGEAGRFELAGKPHHHHFRCENCRRVFDVPCSFEPADGSVPDGFTLNGHDVLLYGTCPDCNG